MRTRQRGVQQAGAQQYTRVYGKQWAGCVKGYIAAASGGSMQSLDSFSQHKPARYTGTSCASERRLHCAVPARPVGPGSAAQAAPHRRVPRPAHGLCRHPAETTLRTRNRPAGPTQGRIVGLSLGFNMSGVGVEAKQAASGAQYTR